MYLLLQAAMCYVHVTALVAEYLTRKGEEWFLCSVKWTWNCTKQQRPDFLRKIWSWGIRFCVCCVCVCVCCFILWLDFCLTGYAHQKCQYQKEKWTACCHIPSYSGSISQTLVNGLCIWVSLTSQSLAERVLFFLKIVPTATVCQSKDSCNRRSSDGIFWKQPSWLYCVKRQPCWLETLPPSGRRWQGVHATCLCILRWPPD